MNGILARFRRQDGLIREALIVFLVFAIIALVMLDVLSVVSTRRTLKEEAGAAARAAADAFVVSRSQPAAADAARKYVENQGAKMSDFVVSAGVDGTIFTVTATKEAPTRLFKYFGYLPWVGKWVKRQLHPHMTSDNVSGS